jgi:hypothetical protein
MLLLLYVLATRLIVRPIIWQRARFREDLIALLGPDAVRATMCCAFAGDRGLLHEELTCSATRQEASEVAGRKLDLYLSAN